VLDEDTPGGGAFYCTPCSRYFVSERALGEHSRTKPHKRRLKELHGAQPHRQKDAEGAAGMGAADNGQQQQRRKEQQAPAAAAMEM
jgi:bud site selection protein 20